MIIKSSCRGSQGLAAHLSADENEVARVTSAEGIVSLDIDGAIAELIGQGAGSRTRSPLVHVSISPQQSLTDQQWARAWSEWEWARGLQEQPCIEVEHKKQNRVHRHRVYCRVDLARQVVIKQSHEKRINERVARSLELEFDHPLTPGAHSRAVQHWAEQHGRTDLAAAVAPVAAGDRPRADLPHHHWQQQERTGVDLAAVADAAFAAWRSSDSLQALESALSAHGLALAAGRKTVQLVDGAGECHDLRRTLGKRDRSIRAANVKARVPMDQLAPVHEVSEAQRAAARIPTTPDVPADVGTYDQREPAEIPTQSSPTSITAAEDWELTQEVSPRSDHRGQEEVDRIWERLRDIDIDLEQTPVPPDREQVRRDASERAKRKVSIPSKQGGYTTLDALDERAAELRSRATRERERAENTPRWRFIERVRASRRATAAEYRADRAESVASQARSSVDARPDLWQPRVDDALARHDERVEQLRQLEIEREELEERLEILEPDPVDSEQVGPDPDPNPGSHPDDGEAEVEPTM